MLGNPIIFFFFRGVQTFCPPSVFRPWHASERRYLSEMFLSACGDHLTHYKSWYACLSPDQARWTICLQTLIAGRKSRKRERETARCLHTNVWDSQSIFRRGPKTQTYRANRLLYGLSINALRTFYRMHTFLN